MTYDMTISEFLLEHRYPAPTTRDDLRFAATEVGVALVEGRIPAALVSRVSGVMYDIAKRRQIIDNKHFFYGDSADWALCRTCNAPRDESCHYPENR